MFSYSKNIFNAFLYHLCNQNSNTCSNINKGTGNDYLIVSSNWGFVPDDDLHLYPLRRGVFRKVEGKTLVIIRFLLHFMHLSLIHVLMFSFGFCNSSSTERIISAILRSHPRSQMAIGLANQKTQGLHSPKLHFDLPFSTP